MIRCDSPYKCYLEENGICILNCCSCDHADDYEGVITMEKKCIECKGIGSVQGEECPECKGFGRIDDVDK